MRWSFRHLSMPAFIYSGNCNSLLQDIRLCAFYEALPPEKQKKKRKKEKKVRRREKRNEKKVTACLVKSYSPCLLSKRGDGM